jgi:hypothetical protein
MFTKTFGSYVCPGDSIACEKDGFTFHAIIHRDDSADQPWTREDGHGDVTDWTSRAKGPGELVLANHRGSFRYYDFAGAVAKAKAEGWDTAPYGQGTAGERAERAARADFERLKAWCNDEWFLVGVSVVAQKGGVQLVGKYDCALWGIESDAGDYLVEVANELLDDALACAKEKLAKLCDCGA